MYDFHNLCSAEIDLSSDLSAQRMIGYVDVMFKKLNCFPYVLFYIVHQNEDSLLGEVGAVDLY